MAGRYLQNRPKKHGLNIPFEISPIALSQPVFVGKILLAIITNREPHHI